MEGPDCVVRRVSSDRAVFVRIPLRRNGLHVSVGVLRDGNFAAFSVAQVLHNLGAACCGVRGHGAADLQAGWREEDAF